MQVGSDNEMPMFQTCVVEETANGTEYP
jgi:hypothetical protein